MDENQYSVPEEFLEFSRRRRCRRGTQLALLALLSAALWAGLLTLLLLWHWDTLKSFKQLEVAAAQNVSQVSEELRRHQSEQLAQKSQAALVSQSVLELRAEQQRLRSQDSELSRNLGRLQEDLSSIKSQNLNEKHSASGALGKLQEEVAKLRMELQASKAALAAEAARAAGAGQQAAQSSGEGGPCVACGAQGSVCDTCPRDWVSFRQKCYYFGEGATQWILARFACEDLEGRLVSVHSQEEQDFLARHAHKDGSWIGLRDLDVEGEFVWMDGSPVDYSNWQSGEPNNADQGEDCVMMQASGKWNDAFCRSWLDAWVCERLATCGPSAPSDATDAPGSGFTHSP